MSRFISGFGNRRPDPSHVSLPLVLPAAPEVTAETLYLLGLHHGGSLLALFLVHSSSGIILEEKLLLLNYVTALRYSLRKGTTSACVFLVTRCFADQ